MIACLSPADSNYEESLSTLKYAHNTKFINNRPVVNEELDPKDELIKDLQKEITFLRHRLKEWLEIHYLIDKPITNFGAKIVTTKKYMKAHIFLGQEDLKKNLGQVRSQNGTWKPLSIPHCKKMYDKKRGSTT